MILLNMFFSIHLVSKGGLDRLVVRAFDSQQEHSGM